MAIRKRRGAIRLDNDPEASYVEVHSGECNRVTTMKGRAKSGDGDPKQRLLKSGEQLFALVGYRHATIREICERANVNVAMVNYYFGGKEQLYRAVLEYSLGQSLWRHVPPSQALNQTPAEERLRSWVEGLLSHVLEDGGASWNGRLMAREMAEPTFALEIVVDKVIRPRAEAAKAIVRALLGPAASDDDVLWYEQSIVAQCLHYRHNRAILDRLHPSLRCRPEDIATLADHITHFSLGALRAFRTRR
jgi:AcrR family transcriptional regulator